MLIVVTGAFGFIGSNIVKELNKLGFTDIIAVDNLATGSKIKNLTDCDILDYVHKEDFIKAVNNGDYDDQIDYIFHQGACSDTTMQDGNYMMGNNFKYSSDLLEFAQRTEIPLTYASSAAVYGANTSFIEKREFEAPLNVYGYSKFLFDQLVRRYLSSGLTAPIVGLRYFNVYGERESHKGRMASVVNHNFYQYQAQQHVKLFEGCQGYANGGQLRDFISIEDVVKVNMFFFKNYLNDHEEISGIFNCGSGVARSFNDLSLATINAIYSLQGKPCLSLEQAVQDKIIQYIPFPNDLAGRYQCFTQADMSGLIEAGYKDGFLTLEEGVLNYVKYLNAN